MSKLQSLRSATCLDDLATLLGYKPSSLAYIIYKIPDEKKYTTFEVPKKNGELRSIQAPVPRLKTLQQHLSRLLQECDNEIAELAIPDLENKNSAEIKRIKLKRELAHGFKRNRSIYTNALVHKNRRFVLNFDLEDFFPSINFGRIVGYFIRNHHFGLHRDIAVMIAQIACHEGKLPQGSPCSPVISNLIAHLLDVRLVQLARKYGCSYSRYADDITFSTNRKQFPPEIAFSDSNGISLGREIHDQVRRTGFAIKQAKTRLRYRDARQTVTGLVVNQKVNVRSEYYRYARAMAHRFFQFGEYEVPSILSPMDRFDEPPAKQLHKDPYRLEGILQFIHHARDRYDQRDLREKQDNPTATWRLFSDFLYFKHFGTLNKPVIISEGVSDPIYLKLAIKSLAKDYPELIGRENGKLTYRIRFLRASKNVSRYLRLSGGTGELAVFVGKFKGRVAKYQAWSVGHPIIILTDNDKGVENVFSSVKQNSDSRPSTKDNSDYYLVNGNLYLVKTPHVGTKKETAIEDLFDPSQAWETKLLGARKFTRNNDFDENKFYGKRDFAEQIIAKNFAAVNFDGFRPLLDRIAKLISDHPK